MSIEENLELKYPRSKRLILKQWLPWGLQFVLTFILGSTVLIYAGTPEDRFSIAYIASALAEICLWISLGLAVGAFVFFLVRFNRHRLSVSDGNLSYGISFLQRLRVLVPLSEIREIVVERPIEDYIFGLRQLRIVVVGSNPEPIVIDGYTEESALSLQEELLSYSRADKEGSEPEAEQELKPEPELEPEPESANSVFG